VVSHKLARRKAQRPQEERGQVIVLVVVMLIVLLGFAALVVDVGYAYYAHRSLQSSADAAALAGAQELPNQGAAEAVARAYSSSPGNKNAKGNLNDVTTTVTTKCIVSLGGCDPMNAVVVLESAPTKTFFAGLLGIDTFTVKAKATAAMRGGTPKPAHVMIVLDRTGSMGTACTAGGTKLDCAKNGIYAFLGAMDPAYDKVGLVAFAPHNGNVCNQPKTTNGAPSDYDVYTNNYLFVPLSTSYKPAAGAALDFNSPLVGTIDCIKAGGTTVFAAAIDKARDTLAANRDPEAQDVIIFMTDGEANYGACVSPVAGVCSNNTSTYRTNPCKQAVTSARAATDANVWVFGIAYDTPGAGCLGWKATGTSPVCNTKAGFQFVCAEVPAITAATAVKGIAYDPKLTPDPYARFYSQPNPSSLTTLFKSIAAELTEGRLWDDDME
jgi:Flp pilus assembly protein TadG